MVACGKCETMGIWEFEENSPGKGKCKNEDGKEWPKRITTPQKTRWREKESYNSNEGETITIEILWEIINEITCMEDNSYEGIRNRIVRNQTQKKMKNYFMLKISNWGQL